MLSDPDEPRGRWFTHQPNVTGQGIIASYSLRFWALIGVLGLSTGAAASLLIALLNLVQHVAFGYRHGSLLEGARAAPGWRHIAALVVAAGLVIGGLAALGRLPAAGGTEVSEALWLRRGRLALIPSLARGALSIVVVGLGVSLGREAAPQLAGAAAGSRLSDWAQLPLWQRRLLVASGAGAGFAAVYNVPLGGALFALEVLLGTLALPLVLPALATSVIATAVAWISLGTHPTYAVPSYALRPAHLFWAVLMGPLLGVVAVAWVRLVARASESRPRRWARYLAPVAAFVSLALLSIPYPQLLGNGKDVVQLAAVGALSTGLLAVLFALKPLVTAACLASGAPGGLFTPTLTIGILVAGLGGAAWSHLWPGPPLGSYALIGGGAFLAAAMQGPVAGTVIVLELTRHFDSLMAPTLIAVVGATVVARRLGAHSIYSARLQPDPDAEIRTAAGMAAIMTLHALDDQPPELPAQPPEVG